MKNSTLKTAILAVALAGSASLSANQRTAIIIDAPSVDQIDSFQEFDAARFFVSEYPDGLVLTPSDVDKIDAKDIDCIWIHVDRVGIGRGWDRLPAAFSSDATVAALHKFVADGGNLLLTKHATQLITAIGRVDGKFAPGIFGDGDGGEGFDDWTINAKIGYWFVMDPASDHYDPTQFYDRSSHPIYKDIEAGMYNDFLCETFPMEGTGNPETSVYREDHNCMWDLNAFAYAVDGKNTVEKFETETNSAVLGTWGHVIDHAVAGIVEFKPDNNFKGSIIANGLATCEWSPRSGTNVYHDNLKTLTANCIDYLAPEKADGVADIAVSADGTPAVYYNLQGMAVDGSDLVPGIYIVRQGARTSKVIVK
ncbi:MAG: DUF4960 domain-containing protein [Bacteroidales bacterium]|nr:DUF4960 domain-containing protein [Bacteroidales bacterium]